MKIKCKLCGIEEKAIIMKDGLCPTCNKVTAKQIELEDLKKNPRHFYTDQDSAAGRLEQYLISKKIDHIGDMRYMWNKYGYEKRMDKNIIIKTCTNQLQKCVANQDDTHENQP